VLFSTNRSGTNSLWAVPVTGGTPELLGLGLSSGWSTRIDARRRRMYTGTAERRLTLVLITVPR